MFVGSKLLKCQLIKLEVIGNSKAKRSEFTQKNGRIYGVGRDC